MKRVFFVFIILSSFFQLSAQQQSFKIGCVGFYNLENLFDTLDAPDIRDEEFTPEGPKRYGTAIYREKLDHLARVVSELGVDKTPDGVSILGVSEIENRSVLEDFVKHPLFKDRNYQIVHYDSPDRRGIDVGLIYQPKYYQVTNSKAVPLLIYDDSGRRRFTRDVLLVSGLYDGEPLHILVNHWPSRSGGESATQAYRNAGALVCKNICDSLFKADPLAKIIIMGDLNDDPTSPSVRKVLAAKGKKTQVKSKGFYNPMQGLHKKGIGTLAWRDAWNLFDQLVLSKGLIDPAAGGYQYYQTIVHNKKYLLQKTGQYQGYPYRTFVGDNYTGGYSDHFPVYLYLVKAIE